MTGVDGARSRRIVSKERCCVRQSAAEKKENRPRRQEDGRGRTRGSFRRASFGVKAHGLAVLFVHVDLVDVKVVDRVEEEGLADPLAAGVVVNEERLDVVGRGADEAEELTVLFPAREADEGEVGGKHLLVVEEVFFGEEVVRGANGALPDFADARIVGFVEKTDHRSLFCKW